MKTATVHFYVQRKSSFEEDRIIPFEVERLNMGGAMNLSRGIFIAPVPGIYHFSFSCLSGTDLPFFDVFLQLNGINIGKMNNHFNIDGTAFSMISLDASLRLKQGDQISLFKSLGKIVDGDDHFTHFSGWLVEEDIVLSNA